MPSSVPLSISVIWPPTETPPRLLSVTDYWYIVTLNSDRVKPRVSEVQRLAFVTRGRLAPAESRPRQRPCRT
jgi:hypothetical protein